MAGPRPRVFTVPPSAAFLPQVIGALLQGRLVPGFAPGDDALALASATVYLPTRRACSLARDLFLAELGSDAALLPRLCALGDIDEDELAFAAAPQGAAAALDLELAPALDGLERRLLLAELVLKWAEQPALRSAVNAPLVAQGSAAALALADALARLIDDMITRKVAWERLDGLVPDHVDRYWQLTLGFLRIAREHWPAALDRIGAIEAAERRDRLIAAEAARLAGAVGGGPVIAAGSTASMPATAALLATIARLPHGAVVLPGLDLSLDDPAWQLIGCRAPPDGPPAHTHPQFAMHGFLAALGIGRADVVPLCEPTRRYRDHLVSEAMRPAEVTERWSERLSPEAEAEALAAISVIEAAGPEEEALAIAVALREVLEAKDGTAALVTPDRGLARRVVAALGRWNVVAEDTAGDALADTPAGVFAGLAAEAALSGLAPVPLLALLKHACLRLGAAQGAHGPATAVLERAVLRGPRPAPGTAGLGQALASFRENREALHRSDPRRRIRQGELRAATDLAARLERALAPLEAAVPARRAPLAALAGQHRETLFALGSESADDFASTPGEDVAAVLELLDDLAASRAAQEFAVAPADYPEIFRAFAKERVVRPRPAAAARVRIFGLLEARLQHADRIVLSGLVEGTWPPKTRSDPWLSRPMRQVLGLDLPERRIGLTAHDFAQALGAETVFLSRSAKVAGAPTVPSRFWQRLQAVAGEPEWDKARARGAKYLRWARMLDAPGPVASPIEQPAPRPPRAARPTRLSVTEIEPWLRDPYTIYAKHILALRPLDPVDTPPGARDRGTAIHKAIGDFTKQFTAELPADIYAQLLALGRDAFAPLAGFSEAQAFWWPRFERIARWFEGWEVERRAGVAQIHAEVRGEHDIAVGERRFKLVAVADRIERGSDGGYAVLDYKTGRAPSDNEVKSGLAPQLTLEAAILREGGFPGIPAGVPVSALAYVQIKGGDPAGSCCPVKFEGTSAAEAADRALDRLRGVVAKFEDEATAYRSLVHSMWKTRYGDYDHLARVREWSLAGLDDENGGTP